MTPLKSFILNSKTNRLLSWRNSRILVSDGILLTKVNSGCFYSSKSSLATSPPAISIASILNINRTSFYNTNNINLNLKCMYATKSTKNHADSDKNIFNDVLKDYMKQSNSKYSTPSQQDKEHEQQEPVEKLGLFAKFKLMYKQYWYVLIPVHVITSIGWFGGFYYLSKSGVDIPSLLQSLHVSEAIIEKLKGSEMGHIAVAYLCYKIATPARYAVTVGGTTISIKYLVQAGYIKPMPSRTELIRMYEEKKAKRKQENT